MDMSHSTVKDDTTNLSQLKKLRPCGRLETYSTARHHLGFYNNVGLTATYTSSSTNDTSLQSVVHAALHHVIAEHPNLSAIPISEDKSYPDVYFARLPKIDLRTCVEFYTREKSIPQGDEDDGELDELLRVQHGRSFKGDVRSRPYWRLIVSSSSEMPTFTASWIFHHALSDGASSMLFHESFLEGLNGAPLQKEVDPVVKTPSTLLQPSLEELHSMTISWPFFLRAIAGSMLPSYFAPRPPNLWTGHPIDAIVQTPVPYYNKTVVLSSETTKAFATKCRAESTSVTAALSTLLAAVLFPHVRPHNEIKIDAPISLRPVLTVPGNQMVNAITNHTFTFNRIDRENRSEPRYFSWDTAQQAKDELVNEVAKKGADNPLALLKYVSNIHEYFLDKLGKPRDASAEVSNLGVWRPRTPPASDRNQHDQKWTLGRMTFSQSLNRTGAQICLSAVTGGDGCMVLNFTWPEELVRDERDGRDNWVHGIPDLIKGGIKALVRDGLDK